MSFLTARMSTTSLRPLTRSFTTTPVSRLAKMTVVGHLAAQPEVFTAQSGQEVIRYTIGTNSGPPDNRETSWWKVASFPREGTNAKDRLLNLGKGSLIYVEGTARMRKFERDGKTESALSLTQDRLEVLKRTEAEAETGEDSIR